MNFIDAITIAKERAKCRLCLATSLESLKRSAFTELETFYQSVLCEYVKLVNPGVDIVEVDEDEAAAEEEAIQRRTIQEDGEEVYLIESDDESSTDESESSTSAYQSTFVIMPPPAHSQDIRLLTTVEPSLSDEEEYQSWVGSTLQPWSPPVVEREVERKKSVTKGLKRKRPYTNIYLNPRQRVVETGLIHDHTYYVYQGPSVPTGSCPGWVRPLNPLPPNEPFLDRWKRPKILGTLYPPGEEPEDILLPKARKSKADLGSGREIRAPTPPAPTRGGRIPRAVKAQLEEKRIAAELREKLIAAKRASYLPRVVLIPPIPSTSTTGPTILTSAQLKEKLEAAKGIRLFITAPVAGNSSDKASAGEGKACNCPEKCSQPDHGWPEVFKVN